MIRKRLLKLSGRVGISFVAILIMLCLFELGLRLFFPQQLIVLRPDVYYPAEGIGYLRYPNLSTTMNVGERTVHVYTDEDGYRVGKSEQEQEEPADFEILAIGDSFLAALQVEHEEIMTTLLEESLSLETNQSVSITNAGVEGYTPNHYLAMTRRALAENDYDMILVFIYTANDIVAEKVEPLPPQAPTLRHPLRFPKNLSRSEIVDSVLYPTSDFLEAHSHVYIATRNASDTLLARFGLTGAYFPEVLFREHAGSEDWDVTASILNEIALEAEQRQLPIIFVLLPANVQIDADEYEWYQAAFNIDPAEIDLMQPYRILAEKMSQYDLALYDAAPALRDASNAGEDNLYGKVHKHFNAPGHQVVADYLTPIIAEVIQDHSAQE